MGIFDDMDGVMAVLREFVREEVEGLGSGFRTVISQCAYNRCLQEYKTRCKDGKLFKSI